jgi:hypothetical protein
VFDKLTILTWTQNLINSQFYQLGHYHLFDTTMTPRHLVKKSFLWCVLTKSLSAKCFLIKRRGANTKKGKFYFRQLKNNSAAFPIKLFAEIVTSLNWRSKLGRLSLADTSSIPYGTTLLVVSGNTKGGSITVPLTSCLTGLD